MSSHPIGCLVIFEGAIGKQCWEGYCLSLRSMGSVDSINTDDQQVTFKSCLMHSAPEMHEVLREIRFAELQDLQKLCPGGPG